jgi:hypothetical protein
MKRFLILFMVFGLMAGSVMTAEAKRTSVRVERTVEGSYDTQFVPFSGLVTHSCAQDGAIGCVIIQTRAREGFFTARVTDAHGQPVLVKVSGRDPNGEPDVWFLYGSFCGETEQPISFERGYELAFDVGYFWPTSLPTSLASCPPMFGTTGTVSITLSNLP